MRILEKWTRNYYEYSVSYIIMNDASYHTV